MAGEGTAVAFPLPHLYNIAPPYPESCSRGKKKRESSDVAASTPTGRLKECELFVSFNSYPKKLHPADQYPEKHKKFPPLNSDHI